MRNESRKNEENKYKIISEIVFCVVCSRYQMFATEDYVLRSGGALCPQPGCGMGILPGPPDLGGCGDERRVLCDREGGCGYVFCRDCRMGYHFGPCDGPIGNNGGAVVGDISR